MSRKAREDKSTWKIPSIYAFVGAYGPFKAKTSAPLEDVAVFLYNSHDDNNDSKHHSMHSIAGQVQQGLLESTENSCLLVIDIRPMFDSTDEYQEALEAEIASIPLTKRFGRVLLRVLQRLRLRNISLIAEGCLCQILWKLHQADPTLAASMCMIHMKLSATFVNTHLVITSKDTSSTKKDIPLNLMVQDKKKNPRIHMVRCFFPKGSLRETDATSLDAYFGTQLSDKVRMYDPDHRNSVGKALFVSKLMVELSKHTKQFETKSEDVTDQVSCVVPDEIHQPNENWYKSIDWTSCESHIGALVLRGNRCVLVRSLEGKWSGMRIPSVVPKEGESPQKAAIRAVVEFTGVEASEVQCLPDAVLPVSLYGPNGRPIRVQLYPLYATAPPPDGPLEDADMEDDETPYDWYLYSNAILKLDEASVAGLEVMAVSLLQAASVGLVPAKWGGIFGQELRLWNGPRSIGKRCDSSSSSADTTAEESFSSGISAKTSVGNRSKACNSEELSVVKNTTDLGLKRLAQRRSKHRKLPVTVISGFLGSGKTTLLSHILTNYEGFKIALLVNDMGEVNIDAALLKGSVSVRQREEHLVELSNGCICCTLREDLLTEISEIATSEESYDYLVIESSGISEPMPVAETFTFEDDSGSRLGDIAEIDTMVTVVDGSRFFRELDSLESLQERDWHADTEDERTISHLLCDQVEFANVIILNKTDLMKPGEKNKVKLLLQKMNETAVVIESEFSQVSIHEVLGTGLFSMSASEKHQGWLAEARLGEHKPETEEYGIQSFTYRAIKPFNPRKLHELLGQVIGRKSPFDQEQILRAKGFVWLASCSQLQGELSLAGNHYTLLPGNPWWSEIEKSLWPENLESAIAPLWNEPHGDKQQEIVVIGQNLNHNFVTQALNECLVSEDEFRRGQTAWDDICHNEGDPFQADWQRAIDDASANLLSSGNLPHSHD